MYFKNRMRIFCVTVLICVLVLLNSFDGVSAKPKKRRGVKNVEDDSNSPPLPKTRILLSMAPWWEASSLDELDRAKLNSRGFYRDYVSKSHPVLIKGGTSKWPDFASIWTDDSLHNLVGNRTVRVHSCPLQNFHFHLYKDANKSKKMKMRFFLTRYNANDRRKRQILENVSLNKKLPGMLSYMRKPAFTGALESVGQRFSMGAGQEIIPPRIENTENVVVCVDGPVNITLFPPTDFNYLYPIESVDQSHNAPFLYSEVNTKRMGKKAKEHFPLLRKSHSLTVTLKPGEMIYIPSYWWHKYYASKRYLLICFRHASNSRLADAAFEAALQRVKVWREGLTRKEAAESKAPGTGLSSQGMRGGEGKKGQTVESIRKEKEEL